MVVAMTFAAYAMANLVLVAAAVSDVRTLTIPNRFVLTLLGLWAVVLVIPPFPGVIDLATQIAVGGLVFAMALGLFAFNLLGGGDGKLLAVLALWAGLEDVMLLLLATVIAGGGVALVMLGVGVLKRFQLSAGASGGVKDELRRQIPYGVAIAIGGVVVLGQRMGVLAATGF